MSHLRAVDSERFRAEEQGERTGARRLGIIAVVAVVALAMAACVMEMRVVASSGGDDAQTVLFVFG